MFSTFLVPGVPTEGMVQYLPEYTMYFLPTNTSQKSDCIL